MAKNKKSVLLYCDILHTVEQLDNETAGELFKHYLRYINDLNPISENIIVNIAFEPIKQNLKRDLKKWETTIETKSKSGALGNLKRWHLELYNKVVNEEITLDEAVTLSQTVAGCRTAINNIANIAVKDTVTVNVNDKVKDINNILLSEIKISDLEEHQIDYFKISLKFQELFIKNLKEKNAPSVSQEKAKFKSYVDPIRLMFEVDKITKEQLIVVYNYLDSASGEFWKSNILSTKKLRDKFQQLYLKANETKKEKSFAKKESYNFREDVLKSISNG